MLAEVLPGLSRRGSRVRVPSAPPVKSITCAIVGARGRRVFYWSSNVPLIFAANPLPALDDAQLRGPVRRGRGAGRCGRLGRRETGSPRYAFADPRYPRINGVGIQNIVKRPQARAILRLLVAEGRRLPILSAYYHQEVASRGNAALRRIVAIGIERGEFSIEMSKNVSHVLLGPLIASLFWQLLFEDIEPLRIDALCELHIRMALNGLVRRH
jgi:hypothetical protein